MMERSSATLPQQVSLKHKGEGRAGHGILQDARSPVPAARSATCSRRQGDLAAALTSYRASLAIAERLAQTDPGNAGWQRDVAISNERLGDIYSQEENPMEAQRILGGEGSASSQHRKDAPRHPDLRAARQSGREA
jgi:hypothetical protein